MGRRVARRYQLNKHALAVIARGHPWIFRNQLSSAAAGFADGQWLRLYDGKNQVVGFGVFESEGAIAIRILSRGDRYPGAAHWRQRVAEALDARQSLRVTTTGFRAIHGENDGIAAVVVDVFADVAVVQSYSAGTEALARFVARCVARELGLVHIVYRVPTRRRGDGEMARVLRGAPPPVVGFREDDHRFVAAVTEGQKTGAFLDLRGLRRELGRRSWAGARVLNLFSYSGMLSRVLEERGAAEITNVDSSADALAHGALHHVSDGHRVHQVQADVFEWLFRLEPAACYDLVIVDPPSMTSRSDQVPRVLATYGRLFAAAGAHLATGGLLVAACCTSRIARKRFRDAVAAALGPEFVRERELVPEPDHPARFDGADYLKVVLFRRRGTG
jgi:23S rRNA (cytosine1962-C5)-methyltransferase